MKRSLGHSGRVNHSSLAELNAYTSADLPALKYAVSPHTVTAPRVILQGAAFPNHCIDKFNVTGSVSTACDRQIGSGSGAIARDSDSAFLLGCRKSVSSSK